LIRARLYDGRTSAARAVTVTVTGAGRVATLILQEEGTAATSTVSLGELVFGARVGTTNRLVQLSGGRSLEVLDNAAFDAALEATGIATPESSLRSLEGRWHYAILALLALVLSTVGFLRFGVPALATHAMRYIPPGADALIGADGLRVLDRSTFRPSKLTAERQAQLRTIFAETARGASEESPRFRLEFRGGGSIGPNALALPSGIVVLTDELEHLARNDDELRGVFAHEIGHLVHRHAMRMLLQNSASALLMVGILGDVSGVSALVTAAPTLLVNAAYSRDFEREADAFAFDWMARHGIAPERLGELLARVSAKVGGDTVGYLASHPDFRERVRAAQLHDGARGAARTGN
jgi:Zn-dependent protease with chaperone function